VLGVTDVAIGAVANLNGDELMRDAQVTGHKWLVVGDVGVRPFLCVAVKGERSEWLELTRKWSQHRLCIDDWKQHGSTRWMRDNQYVNDARQVLSGPIQSFIHASIGELPYHPPGRPSVNSQGVQRVHDEIMKYNPDWASDYLRQAPPSVAGCGMVAI
jgi:hypothetical protein